MCVSRFLAELPGKLVSSLQPRARFGATYAGITIKNLNVGGRINQIIVELTMKSFKLKWIARYGQQLLLSIVRAGSHLLRHPGKKLPELFRRLRPADRISNTIWCCNCRSRECYPLHLNEMSRRPRDVSLTSLMTSCVFYLLRTPEHPFFIPS